MMVMMIVTMMIMVLRVRESGSDSDTQHYTDQFKILVHVLQLIGGGVDNDDDCAVKGRGVKL